MGIVLASVTNKQMRENLLGGGDVEGSATTLGWFKSDNELPSPVLLTMPSLRPETFSDSMGYGSRPVKKNGRRGRTVQKQKKELRLARG